MKAARASRGFALIETLIAWVILTIGLLGTCLATLQATKAANESRMRTQALVVVDSLADRMRANLAGVVAGDYQLDFAGPPTAPRANCMATECSSDELARTDLWDWYLRGRAVLPGFEASAACDPGCARGAAWIITVRWEDTGISSNVPSCGANALPGHQCYQLRFLP